VTDRPPSNADSGTLVCPCNPEGQPRRPVTYAWCTGCQRVVKSQRPCPLGLPPNDGMEP
jgi:hypothetical protein